MLNNEPIFNVLIDNPMDDIGDEDILDIIYQLFWIDDVIGVSGLSFIPVSIGMSHSVEVDVHDFSADLAEHGVLERGLAHDADDEVHVVGVAVEVFEVISKFSER